MIRNQSSANRAEVGEPGAGIGAHEHARAGGSGRDAADERLQVGRSARRIEVPPDGSGRGGRQAPGLGEGETNRCVVVPEVLAFELGLAVTTVA